MSSSHMIIIRWNINEKMITLCTAVHFNAGSNMHPSMNLSEYIRIFVEKSGFCEINKNSRLELLIAYFKCECAGKFLVARITIIVNMIFLMRCIVSFCAKCWVAELALVFARQGVYKHVILQQWKLFETKEMQSID